MSIQNNSWQYEEQDPQRYATNEQNRALGQGIDKERGAYDYEREKQAIANDVVSANNLIAQNAQQWQTLNLAGQIQDFKKLYAEADPGEAGNAQRAMAAAGGQMIRRQLQNMGADPSVFEAADKLDSRGFGIMLDGMKKNNLSHYLSMENPDVKFNRLMESKLKQGMNRSQARDQALAETAEYASTYNQLGKLAMGQYGAGNDIVGRNAAMIAALNNDPRTLQILASVLPTRADEIQHDWKVADREQVADIAARQSAQNFGYKDAMLSKQLASAERVNNANNAIKKYGIDVGRDVSLAKINADISMWRERLKAMANGVSYDNNGNANKEKPMSKGAQLYARQIAALFEKLMENEASEDLRVETGTKINDIEKAFNEAYENNEISKEERDALRAAKENFVDLRQDKWYPNKHKESAKTHRNNIMGASVTER